MNGDVELEEDAEMADRFGKRTKDVSHDVDLKKFNLLMRSKKKKLLLNFLLKYGEHIFYIIFMITGSHGWKYRRLGGILFG